MTASIPVYRLPVHIPRLLEAGYKGMASTHSILIKSSVRHIPHVENLYVVGVVKQREQTFTKKFAKSQGPFVRELTDVYTKATWIPEDRWGVTRAYVSPPVSSA